MGTEIRDCLRLFAGQHRFLLQHVTDASIGNRIEAQRLKLLIKTVNVFHQQILLTSYRTLQSGSFASQWHEDAYLHQISQNEAAFLKTMMVIRQVARDSQEILDNEIYWMNVFILASLVISLLILALMVITPIFKNSIRDYRNLLIAKNEADAANKAKSVFMSNMSHELRTPMNGIIGFTDLVLTSQLTDSQREYLHHVSNSSYILLDIINDILNFSKIEAGKLTIEQLPFNLNELVEGAVDMLSLKALEKNIELVCNIDPGIPSQFMGDTVRIKQILVNLLGNAINVY